MSKALIIKKEWLDRIFDNGKIWEMRSTNTKIRGKIQLIESKSGTIVGECEITGSHKLSEQEKISEIKKHQVEDNSLLEKWCFAWHLENAIRYDEPIPYVHPKGAVIWVNL